MITIERLKNIVDGELKKKDLHCIDLSVSRGNKIMLYIDSSKGVTIDECAEISRFLEDELNRDEEDFELEVSSPGLDKPLKLPFQYMKNIGRNIDVVITDGQKIRGKLIEAGENKIVLEVVRKVHLPGKKKKTETKKEVSLDYTSIKSTKVIIIF